MGIIFESVPMGSLQALPPEKRLPYIKFATNLPDNLRDVVSSGKTGAFVRGLAKTYKIPEDQIPSLAFAIFRILVGENTLAQLAALLSTDLKIPNDKAQKIAQEIERDLIAPIAMDLNRYLAEKNKTKGSITEKFAGARKAAPPKNLGNQPKAPPRPTAPSNILNLKDDHSKPKPPPIPK